MSLLGCLGKLAVRLDPRTLQLKTFLKLQDLPSPPPMRDWIDKLPDDVGMMANDNVGCCTAASLGHLEQIWTSQAGEVINPTDREVLDAYAAYSGWTPSDPQSDAGADMLTALNYARNTGLGGRKIGAFLKLEHRDPEIIKAVIDYFGGIYCGAMMPVTAQTTLGWTDTKAEPGGWGGHCMAAGAYDRGEVTFITWGHRQRASWAWWTRYVDEAYAIISNDWLEKDGTAPNGLDVGKLNAALKKVAA